MLRGGGEVPTSTPVAGGSSRVSGLASMIALQRSAGNTSSLALLRRARAVGEEPPITLTLPGVVDRAGVTSWSLRQDTHGRSTGVDLTRISDADSPRLVDAFTHGAPAVTATLLVRKLTPLGSIRELTLTMEDCTVDSFQVDGDHDAVGLNFDRIRVEQ